MHAGQQTTVPQICHPQGNLEICLGQATTWEDRHDDATTLANAEKLSFRLASEDLEHCMDGAYSIDRPE